MGGIHCGDAGFLIDHDVLLILPLYRDEVVREWSHRYQPMHRHGRAGLHHQRRHRRRLLRHGDPPRGDEALGGGAGASRLRHDEVEERLRLLRAIALLYGRGIDRGGEPTGRLTRRAAASPCGRGGPTRSLIGRSPVRSGSIALSQVVVIYVSYGQRYLKWRTSLIAHRPREEGKAPRKSKEQKHPCRGANIYYR